MGMSLVVQRFRPHSSTVRGESSTPGWETKIPDATWHCKKKKSKKFH